MEEKPDHICLTESVPSIPSEWYHNKLHFTKELDRIWRKNWIYVCAESALDEKLSFKTVQFGKENIIVLRNSAGKLKAFHNTCRHRGARLCTEKEGKLKANMLVCPYHQWSYSCSMGELKGNTSVLQPKNFEKSDYNLFNVPIKVYLGLVFINLNEEATWDDNVLFQQSEPILSKVPIRNMIVGHTWRKVVNCNWKIYWENYSECLHCPNVHPELSKLVPVYSRRLNNIKEAPGWEEKLNIDHPKYQGGLRNDARTWSIDGSSQGHEINDIKNHEDLLKGQAYASSWPSMFIGIYRDHVRIVRMLPIDEVSTELLVEWLFEPDALADENYDMKNVTDFSILVMEQDAHICEINQLGIHSSAFSQGVLMPEEYTIKEFHDWLKTNLNTNV